MKRNSRMRGVGGLLALALGLSMLVGGCRAKAPESRGQRGGGEGRDDSGDGGESGHGDRCIAGRRLYGAL